MRHSLPVAPQFFVTAPQPCPYLPGRTERKLFTAMQGEHAGALHDSLSKQGFRRSQNVLYRPSCGDCTACLSARIRARDFKPSRNQSRVLHRNADLRRRIIAPRATREQFSLFRSYLDSRHADGGMADMTLMEYAAMVEETPVNTRLVEYRDRATRELVAVCLTDILDDGVSMVYSFFDPSRAATSPGTFLILDHIGIATGMALPHVYLGYWVPGSARMGYKARFHPLEVYAGGKWQEVHDPAHFPQAAHPLSVEPVAEQVARITLPDLRPAKG
ncbi:MAG: arginyltransferase [Rubellimicrobium sp.]|nr:arginyltransferase [Rubellimicrobium sp.]